MPYDKCDGLGWLRGIKERCDKCDGYGNVCSECGKPESALAASFGEGCDCNTDDSDLLNYHQKG